jgi:hypothetical protein
MVHLCSTLIGGTSLERTLGRFAFSARQVFRAPRSHGEPAFFVKSRCILVVPRQLPKIHLFSFDGIKS